VNEKVWRRPDIEVFILYLVHPFFFGTTDHVNTLGTEGGKWKFRAVSFGCSGSRGEGLWKPQPLTAPLPGQQRVIEVVAPVGIAVDAFRAAQVGGQLMRASVKRTLLELRPSEKVCHATYALCVLCTQDLIHGFVMCSPKKTIVHAGYRRSGHA